MITFEIFEETGPAVSGRGSVTAITNVNWKNSEDVTQAYYFYPLRQPALGRDQTLSYKKYIFFKVSGDYTYLKNLKISITPTSDTIQATNTQLFYKFSNVYAEPTNAYDGDMINTNNAAITWYPNISTVSPLQATARSTCVNDQTFVTGYFVTQMRVNQDVYTNVGNSIGFEIKFSATEFE